MDDGRSLTIGRGSQGGPLGVPPGKGHFRPHFGVTLFINETGNRVRGGPILSVPGEGQGASLQKGSFLTSL